MIFTRSQSQAQIWPPLGFQEDHPACGGRSGSVISHVLGDTSRGDVDAELAELSGYALLSPQWVLGGHAPDQVLHVFGERRPTRRPALLSLPPAAQRSVPSNDGLRLHDHQRVTPPGPTFPQHHPEPPVLLGELQSPSVLLTLVYLQLLLERDDAKTLLASAEEEQRDHPEEKLHEHPLAPRLRSETWQVRRGASHGLANTERTIATTGLSLRSIELALYSHSGTPTGICGLHGDV
jgi:hypothetical protein